MNHQELIHRLNQDLELFREKFSAQFHLKIPKGVVKKVDVYRLEFFDYLEESTYKSNICYLLQLIDYQLWLYQLFRPSLSLENTYFYQLLVSMGVTAEGLVVAILLNPYFKLKQSERDANFSVVTGHIVRNSFHKNIEALKSLKVLPGSLVSEYQTIRTEIRNIVHIQNWEGKLHESLTAEIFQSKMQQFKTFLIQIKENIRMESLDMQNISMFFFKAEIDFTQDYQGSIINFVHKGGYGFIQVRAIQKEIYFHISDALINEKAIKPGLRVTFQIQVGRSGLEARKIVSSH